MGIETVPGSRDSSRMKVRQRHMVFVGQYTFISVLTNQQHGRVAIIAASTASLCEKGEGVTDGRQGE
jgi:hypothetical protein